MIIYFFLLIKEGIMEPTVWSNSTSYFLPILADTLFLELPSHVKGLIEFLRGKYIGEGMRGKKVG